MGPGGGSASASSPWLGCALRGLGCLPLIFGILFLIGGLTWYSAFNVPASWPRTQGQVIELNGESRVTNLNGTAESGIATLMYEVGVDVYRVDVPIMGNTRVAMGDRMTVAYDPLNPADGRLVNNPLFGLVWLFGSVGGVGFVVGLAMVFIGPLRMIAFANRDSSERRGRGQPPR